MFGIVKNKYLVGTLCGGLQEFEGRWEWDGPFEIIEATSKSKAEKIYNKKNNCNYFYGSVMAVIICGVPFDINKYASRQEINEILMELK